MKNKKTRKEGIAFLVLWPIVAAFASWVFPSNFFESSILFFAVPGVYLSWRNPPAIKSALAFSSIFTVAGTGIDYAAVQDKTWSVPTIFPFRIGGAVAVEDVVWFFLLTYMIIAYFEFFYDHLHHKTLGKRMPYLYLITLITLGCYALLSLTVGHAYDISYFYLKSGLVLGFFPVLGLLFEFPRLISTFFKTAPYFIAVCFIEEIVGLHGGYWSFPGSHFIGWVQFGRYRFPFEEFFFWIILFSSTILAYFEIFDDNRLKFRFRR
ncbi:MAG TPA: hypothetical protein VFW90_03595 [Candidatus Saccharimonadales bacterium]|nr:hypothetical protein [Candidatus Saccharimonadales bacterium]